MLYTIREAANLLGCSVDRVCRLSKQLKVRVVTSWTKCSHCGQRHRIRNPVLIDQKGLMRIAKKMGRINRIKEVV